MTWVQTRSGRAVDLLAPTPDQIDLGDIGHHLAMLCRFSGATRVFYSVAEHSVRVWEVVRDRDGTAREQRAALMHDAAEAYIGDMVAPLKFAIAGADPVKPIADRLERVIAERFDLAWPWPEVVHTADMIMLATEARDLMAPPPRPWELPSWAIPVPDPILTTMGVDFSRNAFRERAHRLGIE